MKTLTEELSPLLRLTVDSVQKLGGKDEEERLRAIRCACVPPLAAPSQGRGLQAYFPPP